MRITGPGVWGPPADKAASLKTLRRAIELDVNLIDTADSYGPAVSEELIAEALFPYPTGLVIAQSSVFECGRHCKSPEVRIYWNMSGCTGVSVLSWHSRQLELSVNSVIESLKRGRAGDAYLL